MLLRSDAGVCVGPAGEFVVQFRDARLVPLLERAEGDHRRVDPASQQVEFERRTFESAGSASAAGAPARQAEQLQGFLVLRRPTSPSTPARVYTPVTPAVIPGRVFS
jgi:hypothetical protein